MKPSLFLILVCFNLFAVAQEDLSAKTRPIVEEGKKLYRSELASWYGTDIFRQAYKDYANIGGYFSYVEGDKTTCVFYSKGTKPKVVGSITFDSTYNTSLATTNLTERNFLGKESSLYAIRSAAMAMLKKDTFFRVYQNTEFNLVPLIDSNSRRVFVLTGTSEKGVVIFGNDYIISFNSKNKVTSKKRIHPALMPIHYGQKLEDGSEAFGSMHTHSRETGEFITSTDICTLMLYEKFTGWQQHHVQSEHYLNIWDCLNNELTITVTVNSKGQ